MKSINKETIIIAFGDADLDEDQLYAEYSGRSMYGKTCFGITGTLEDYTRFMVQLAIAEPDYAEDLAGSATVDSMGLRSIFYFPGWEVTDE